MACTDEMIMSWVDAVIQDGMQKDEIALKVKQNKLMDKSAGYGGIQTVEELCDGRLLCVFALCALPRLAAGRIGLATSARIAFFQRFLRRLHMPDTDLFMAPDVWPTPPSQPGRLMKCLGCVGGALALRASYTGPQLQGAPETPWAEPDSEEDGEAAGGATKKKSQQANQAKQTARLVSRLATFNESTSTTEKKKLMKGCENMIKQKKLDEVKQARQARRVVTGEPASDSEEDNFFNDDEDPEDSPAKPKAPEISPEAEKLKGGDDDFDSDTLPVFAGYMWKKSPHVLRGGGGLAGLLDLVCWPGSACGTFDERYFVLRDMHLFWWDKKAEAMDTQAERVDGGFKCKGVINLIANDAALYVDENSSTRFVLKPETVWAPGAYTGSDPARAYVFDLCHSEFKREDVMSMIQPHLDHGAKIRKQLGVEIMGKNTTKVHGTVGGFLA